MYKTIRYTETNTTTEIQAPDIEQSCTECGWIKLV